MKSIFGRHLIIDGYTDIAGRLAPDILVDLCDRLVRELGMEYLQRPVAMRVPLDPSMVGEEDDDGGWSVMCMITTSHISIHTWPQRLAFMMDIFSCQEFNVKRAVEIVAGDLWVLKKNMKVHNIERTDP